MQAARSIGEHHVRAPTLRGRQSVENDGSGVCSLTLRDHLDIVALAPPLQLLDSCSAESVSGSEDRRKTLILEAPCKLADRRCLADAVDAHHQYHEGPWLGGHLEGNMARLEHLGQIFTERAQQRPSIVELLALNAGRQARDDLGARIDAHIRNEELRFKLLEKILVEFLFTQNQVAEALCKSSTRTCQTGAQAAKEATPLLWTSCFSVCITPRIR